MVLDLSGGPKGWLLVKKETISRGEDRISLLPESLLCHILSFLRTEEAVCTSVLSSSWKDLWKWVPRLELDNNSFQSNKACVDFINKFLLNSQSLSEFKLFLTNYNERDDFNKVIKKRIQHFQVVYYHQKIEVPLELPRVTLPMCEALVSLKIYSVRLNDCESLSLPCLKVLLLYDVILPSDAVLDTPRLEHLSLADNQLQSFKIISMSDSVKVKIDVDYVLTNYDLSERNILYNFLYNFSAVRDMTLSQYTLELIYCLSDMSPLPKFCDLTRLHATMRLDRCLELLPFVFERCQNLKHLTLKLVEYLEVVEATSLSNMLSFRLVSSSLEYVEIESPITEKAAQLVRYFLGNVTSLKKVVLRLNVFRGEKHDPVLLKQRFDSPRRSNLCQFELLLLYEPPTFGSCLE